MKIYTPVLGGLRFHRRAHFGVFLGAAVASAVLTGALLVGDSVRHTLSSIAGARLGKISFAMESGSRFIDDTVADRLERKIGSPVAPLLQARAVALKRDRDGRVTAAAGVRLLGVDERFHRFAPAGEDVPLFQSRPGSGLTVNRRVSLELQVSPGDVVTLRIGRQGTMPLDAPLSSRAGKLTRLGSFTVDSVVPDRSLGRFSLRAEQVPPANVFIDLRRLQEILELPGKANVMVVASGSREGQSVTEDEINGALGEIFRPGDAGYRLRRYREQGIVQLESERIFIEEAPAAGFLEFTGAAGSFTWLVDSLSSRDAGGRTSTPYSFVSAVESSPLPGLSPVPEDLGDDEIILNRWTADELRAGPGDTVTMDYSVPTAAGVLTGKSREFTVHAVIDMNEAAAERALVPAFPGLTDADTCRDWDIGMPLDEEKLADEANERYWRRYRQTPKAFVTLAAGRSMWSNRWGALTAVRHADYPEGDPRSRRLRALTIDPASAGYVFQDVSGASREAVAGSIDFGGLFLGLSIFLIASALVLTGMVHSFAVQHRAAEAGVLRAVGFSPRQTAALFFSEGAIVSLCGSLAGALIGTLYTRALLWGLGRFWQGAVAGAAIRYHGEPGTVMVGAGAAFLFSLGAVGLTLRHLRKFEVTELLAGDPGSGKTHLFPGKRSRIFAVAAIGGGACSALTILAAFLRRPENSSSLFLASGLILLLSFLAFLLWLFTGMEKRGRHRPSFSTLALRSALRRRGRSIGVAGIFACGTFILVSVSSMRADLTVDTQARSSGTGGFALFGESVLPLLSERLSRHTDVVPIRVRDGDDASCFNLNRAQAPRLLGVDPDDFRSRGAFGPGESRDTENPWDLLGHPLPGGIVPALAGDRDTAQWNLRVQTGVDKGEEITYRDERGRKFRVRIVGALPVRKSVFQGTLLISREAFVRLFPSEEGYRMFLFDPPAGEAEAMRRIIEEEFLPEGMDLTASSERLAAYYAVEHAYLEIFLLLGGLGLLLASFGVAVVVMRNMEERRAEHALLGAVGYPPRTVARLLVTEHAGLFVAGLAGGVLTGLLAVLPAFRSPGVELPARNLFLILTALLAVGLIWIGLTVELGMRRNPVPALRKE